MREKKNRKKEKREGCRKQLEGREGGLGERQKGSKK